MRNKKVYITYDMYNNGEWCHVYQLTTRLSEVRKEYKKHIKDFLMYGPDDLHDFAIQIVYMSNEEYEHLKELVELDDYENKELLEIMVPIEGECDFNPYNEYGNCLLITDGPGDFCEIVTEYSNEHDIDEDESCEIITEMDDDDYEKLLDKYINENYII